jgi:hypothetical protein
VTNKIIKDLDDPRMYKPFASEVKKALTYANKYYFAGRLRVAETYRTPQRQAELYADPKVYAAKAGQSFHNFGCACDIFILDHYGKYSNNVEDYRVTTEIFSRFGLNYLRNSDLAHIEVPTTMNLKDVVNAYMALDHEDLVKQIHCLLDRELASYNEFMREYDNG